MANDLLDGTGKPIQEVARALVGKTIADVSLEVMTSPTGDRWGLETMTFTDGTRLWFTAVLTEDDEVCIGTCYPAPDPKLPKADVGPS